MIMAETIGLSLDNLSKDKNYDFLNILSSSVHDSNRASDFFLDHNDDSPYFNCKFNCKYVDESNVSIIDKPSKSKLMIMSLNIQSLPSKFNDFEDLITSLASNHCNPDVILIQETWQVQNPNLFRLKGYHDPIFKTRKFSQGGGVGIYFKDNLKFKLLNQFL